MITPERRTRADLAVAAAIAAVVAVTAGLLWWTSDARATISHPASAPVQQPASASRVPDTLTELWSVDSPATSGPVKAGGVIVSAGGHEVIGRDPVSGTPRWSYQRDNAELCGVIGFNEDATAVYRDGRGCGQVTMIDGDTGRRGPLRSSENDPQVTLSTDGTYILARGSTRLELWRSDLVRTLEYGRVATPLNPASQPCVGCTLKSAAVGASVLAVLESCPGDQTVRLSLMKPTPKDNDKPETLYSEPLPGVEPGMAAKVLAVADTKTVVYLPGSHAELVVFDDHGQRLSATALPGDVVPSNASTRTSDVVTWWTGSQVLVMRSSDLSYRFTLPSDRPPLGPGVAMAGDLLVPVVGGVNDYNMQTGELRRFIPVQRGPDASGPIRSSVLGSTLVEQRGTRLVALG